MKWKVEANASVISTGLGISSIRQRSFRGCNWLHRISHSGDAFTSKRGTIKIRMEHVRNTFGTTSSVRKEPKSSNEQSYIFSPTFPFPGRPQHRPNCSNGTWHDAYCNMVSRLEFRWVYLTPTSLVSPDLFLSMSRGFLRRKRPLCAMPSCITCTTAQRELFDWDYWEVTRQKGRLGMIIFQSPNMTLQTPSFLNTRLTRQTKRRFSTKEYVPSVVASGCDRSTPTMDKNTRPRVVTRVKFVKYLTP